jgi:hypothetical protein
MVDWRCMKTSLNSRRWSKRGPTRLTLCIPQQGGIRLTRASPRGPDLNGTMERSLPKDAGRACGWYSRGQRPVPSSRMGLAPPSHIFGLKVATKTTKRVVFYDSTWDLRTRAEDADAIFFWSPHQVDSDQASTAFAISLNKLDPSFRWIKVPIRPSMTPLGGQARIRTEV